MLNQHGHNNSSFSLTNALYSNNPWQIRVILPIVFLQVGGLQKKNQNWERIEVKPLLEPTGIILPTLANMLFTSVFLYWYSMKWKDCSYPALDKEEQNILPPDGNINSLCSVCHAGTQSQRIDNPGHQAPSHFAQLKHIREGGMLSLSTNTPRTPEPLLHPH